ncbi:MAG: PilN domain-containing protein [Armatimonadota bacterium]
MPYINLIREQREASRKKENAVRVAFMGTLAIGGLAVLVAGGLFFDATRLTLEANATEERKAKMKPLLDELKKNQDELDQLKPRLETLQQAQSVTLKWGNVLDYLTKNTPDGLWLTGVRSFQQDRTKPLTITFAGMSSSQETIGKLILQLNQSKDIENVTFKGSSERSAENNTKYYEFEITADLAGSKQADAPKEKGASA